MTTTNSNTKTDERDKWLAKIERALTELQSDIPGMDRGSRRSEDDGDSSIIDG